MASRDVKDADVASKLTARGLEEIRREYNIPTTVKLFLPSLHQRVNDQETFRIAVHEETLRIGIRLPFEGLAESFLVAFGVTPGQLTPNSWRIIREIAMWAEDNEVQISGRALLHLLTLKRSGDFVVVQGAGNSKIVSGMPTSNKGWKPGFFFAKRVNGRGEFVPWNVPYKWRSNVDLPAAEPLTEADAEALEALRIAIGSQGLPYTPAARAREKMAAATKRPRSRGKLRKASGEPLAIQPLQVRIPDRASPPKKKRKGAAEPGKDEVLERVLRESAQLHEEEQRAEAEQMEAAMRESARAYAEGDLPPTDEEQMQLALAEAAEVGILLISGDEASPVTSPRASAEPDAAPVPVEVVEVNEAEAVPVSGASAEPVSYPREPVLVPVETEAHRARVEELLIEHAPEATSNPGLNLSLMMQRRAAAEKTRAALRKKAGLGSSTTLSIAGQAKGAVPEGAEAVAALAKKQEDARQKAKAMRRLRRLEKQPAFPEVSLPRRYVGKGGEEVRASDVEYDLHAFAKEAYVSEREGRPLLAGRGSFNPKDLEATLDRKMDHLQADFQTVLEDYRRHLRQSVRVGVSEARKMSFEEGKAATEGVWYEKYVQAEAEARRHRNTIFEAENRVQVARQTTFEAEAKIAEAKAAAEKAEAAKKEAQAAKEAAMDLAREEARRELRDELALLRGQALAADAITVEAQRQAKEQEKAAEESRREAAEARKEAAKAREHQSAAEAWVAKIQGKAAEAEVKEQAAVRRAEEAEKASSEALARAEASDKALAEAQGELARVEEALSEAKRGGLEQALQEAARAEAVEKALTVSRARIAELEELVQTLDAAARAATVLAESQQREAEAAAARANLEGFNLALATVEEDVPGLELTHLYRIPDSPDPPVDGEP